MLNTNTKAVARSFYQGLDNERECSMGYSVPAKIECHETAGLVAFYLPIFLSSYHTIFRLRIWSHPRRTSFLCADCIFAFQFFSSHLEITLLFCLRYFRYCTHAFEVQCFRVLHRAVYRSWCVNSHEPIHGNLELEAVIAAKDFVDLHW